MVVSEDNCLVGDRHLPYGQEGVGDVRCDNGLGGYWTGGLLKRVSYGVCYWRRSARRSMCVRVGSCSHVRLGVGCVCGVCGAVDSMKFLAFLLRGVLVERG